MLSVDLGLKISSYLALCQSGSREGRLGRPSAKEATEFTGQVFLVRRNANNHDRAH